MHLARTRSLPLVTLILIAAVAGAESARAGARQLRSVAYAQEVTPQEVLEILIEGDGPVIIDCRHIKFYEEGHIPGALHFFHKDTWGRIDELRKFEEDRGIVYYDLKGVLSKVATRALLREGFRKLGFMKGHFQEWKRLGYPVAVGAPPE